MTLSEYLNTVYYKSLTYGGYNIVPKAVAGWTKVTFAFGGAGNPDIGGGFTFPTIDWTADPKVNPGPSGQIRLMNGDVIFLGNLKGAQASVFVALRMWADVAQIGVYQTSQVNSATFKFYEASPKEFGLWGGNTDSQTILGLTAPSGSVVLNDRDWNTTGSLLPGSFAFTPVLHEVGHLFGLAHPFLDDSSDHNETYFPGTEARKDPGTFGLNQGVFTVMSYSPGYGGQGAAAGLGAFDIAAVQAKYGANFAYHSGNDTYVLPSMSGDGVGWMCLWDGGGNDTIQVAETNKNAVIDLRSATLNEADGQGAGIHIKS